MKYAPVFYLFLLLSTGCRQPETKTDALFEKVDSDKSGVKFVNKVENAEDFNIFSYRNFYNGGGVALGDINNDGLPDIFFTSNMGENKLYLNKGNFQFEDISIKSGIIGNKAWSTGVVMVDINNDGLLDIYVCNAGFQKGLHLENELFINQGLKDGVPYFVEKAAEYGLDEKGYTTHAAFFDYDGDGDLDCYILNNSFMPVNTLNFSNNRELYAEDWDVPEFLKGGGDKLLRNDNGHFTDVTRQSGIYGSLIGFGLGVSVCDVNGDHLPDLYISNDFYERDYLYINQGNGTFKEDLENRIQHLSLASMGSDIADINNDGFPEIFTTEMLPDDEVRLKSNTVFENYQTYQLKQERGFYHQYMQNCLQLNNKNGTFSEIARYAGVDASDWSWGALMFDADNDGFRDIYVCNGIYQDVINQDFIDFFADDVVQKLALNGKKGQINDILSKMPSNPILNKAYHNTGALRFDDTGKQWGFTTPSFSNGAAYADLDNDGDLDLVVNNVNQEAFIYRNRENELLKNHHLSVLLKGKDKNTFAIGSTVTVYKDGQQINTQLNPSRGFQSSVEYKMIFGLGKSPAIDSLVVIWPDRHTTVVPHPPGDTTLTFSWADASNALAGNLYQQVDKRQAVLHEVPNTFEAHHEDDFVDFYQESLSFRMLSREGPQAAVADVNGDGLEDVFIGGAAGQGGQLYLQTASGSFNRSEKETFEQTANFEDTAVLFFDADGDGHPDLFVGSGGNEQPANSRFMQNRLYMNDGKGHFRLNERAFPLNGLNTGAVVAFDYDGDGDLDLFVGSRSIPAQYGIPARHFLYQNDGKGNFRDVTKTAAPDFSKLGMVTGAVIADVTGDGHPELIVIGEWRSPKVFQITNGHFDLLSCGLDGFSGWWSAIRAEDIDGDGDLDLILGNRGENFYFTGSADKPAKLWVNDFDQNGAVDKIMTRSINGKDMPIPMKKELTNQIPGLKKQNLKHADYATKSIQELFPKQAVDQALVLEGNYFKSAVAINNGKGQFTMQPLPAPAQFSCVKTIWCGDLNGDGLKDLVLGGNDAGFLPQFSKLDASFGQVFLNKGAGQFEELQNVQSGFFVRGDVKTIAQVSIKGKKNLLVTVNNSTPKLFEIK